MAAFSKGAGASVIVTSLVAWALTAIGCRTTAEKLPPVSEAHLEAMTNFIKHQACQPSSCANFACETVSDGQTKGLPSHLVRCRWEDSSNGTPGTFNRCAFVHYSVDAGGTAYRNLFLSSVGFSDACPSDKEFYKLIKIDQGYSGRVP
jgi:hypothetical protein